MIEILKTYKAQSSKPLSCPFLQCAMQADLWVCDHEYDRERECLPEKLR